MRLTLFSSALVTLLVTAPWALAQTPGAPSVTILAQRNYVVAARGMQLVARSVNEDAALVAGSSYQWLSSDPTRASIDDTGMLRGLSPGPVEITATDIDTGISSKRTFTVYPGRIVITGGSLSVPAGQTLQLAAQALDADAKPIPNVAIQWFTDKFAVGKISTEGLFTGIGEGQATVGAGLDMGPAFARFTAFTTVTVLRRPDFRLRSIISTATTAAVSMLAPTRVATAGAFVAGITSLSNGGQGLVLTQNGPLQLIFSSGSALNKHVVTRLDGVSVNSRGDVLVLAYDQAEWCGQMLILFTAASKWRPTVVDDVSNCNFSAPPPASLDSQGGVAYRYGQTLYYRKPDGSRQTILTNGDKPAGVSAINNINNWGFSRSGKLSIDVNDASSRSAFLSWDGTKFEKLFAVGDPVENGVIQRAGLPVEVNPGEYIVRVTGLNWSGIGRLKNGAWSLVVRNGRDNINWVHDFFDAADGDIFFWANYFSDGPEKDTLMRWDGTKSLVLATYSTWADMTQISAMGNGSVLALGVMGGSTLRAARFTGPSTPVTILGPFLPVDSKAPAALGQLSVPKGVNLSGAILRTSGDTLLRATSSGVSVLLKPGDSLPVGSLSVLGGFATNRLGDAAFTAQHGGKQALYAYQNGRIQAIAEQDDQIPSVAQITGFPLWSDTQLAMNNRGHIASRTSTTTGDTLFLFTQNAASAKLVARLNAAIPGTGVILTSLNQVAIDENDRVAFIGNTNSGKSGVFIWDQGAVTEVLETGQLDSTGRAYQWFGSLQAAGSRFYVRASSGSNLHLVIEGTTPKLLLTEGYATTFGKVVSNLFGVEMAANSRGDFVFPAATSTGGALVVKRAGSDVLVAIGNQRGPEQEWFLQIFGAGISEQGEIIFSALVSVDGVIRLGLYEAIPAP